MPQRILAIETATQMASFALLQGTEVISRSVDIPQKHSLSALPLIDELLSEAGITLQMLDAIAVGQGPGSFTGVRLAISLAQGLSFGAQIPCIPISTLAVLAYGARAEAQKRGLTIIVPAMDARMQEIYGGVYQLDFASGKLMALTEDFVGKPAEVNQFHALGLSDQAVIAIGTGWSESYAAELMRSMGVNPISVLSEAIPQAVDLAKLAALVMQSGETDMVSAENLIPAYCRNKVVF